MSETLGGTAAAPDRLGTTLLAAAAAAGRAVPVSLFAALPGLVFAAGFDHLAYGLGLLAGIVIAGQLIAPRLARAGAASVTGSLGKRFGAMTATVAGIVVWLVVFPVMAIELAFVGIVAESGLGLPYLPAVIGAAMLALGGAMALTERAFAALAAAAFALLAVALLLPLALMAASAHGSVLPQLGYGAALPEIAKLEETLIENALIDFDTFAAHVTPFVRLGQLDLFALVVSLALGLAAFPPLLASLAASGPVSRIRMTGAWTALLMMVVLVSVPALAAYAKLQVYGAIAGATRVESLPKWLEAPLAADLARVHGVSLAMLDETAKAVHAGVTDPVQVGDRLAWHGDAMDRHWQALADAQRAALIETAATLAPAISPGELWQAYVSRVLPAVASAAGDETGVLSQSALAIDPAGLLLALPGLSGAPGVVAILLAAGALGAGLVMIAALARSLVTPSSSPGDASGRSPGWTGFALPVASAVMAAAVAAIRPGDPVTLVVSSFSLAAAGLFPALVGLSWRKATAAGVVAAMVAGSLVTLYYDVAKEAAPVHFYRTWSALSEAGEQAVEEFAVLEEAVTAAGDDEAREAASAALADFARGTPARPGLANWAGIDGAVGGVFGIPLAFLLLIAVSRATRAKSRSA